MCTLIFSLYVTPQLVVAWIVRLHLCFVFIKAKMNKYDMLRFTSSNSAIALTKSPTTSTVFVECSQLQTKQNAHTWFQNIRCSNVDVQDESVPSRA